MKNLYLKYKEIINYLIVGVLTTVVSLGTYYFCVSFFFDPQKPLQLQTANVIAWIAAVTFAYFTNRKYVFESVNQNIAKEAASFYLSRVSTLLMYNAIIFISVTLLGMNDKIAKLIVQVVVTVANYIFSKMFVFKKQ